jgi:hypothetical protein
MTQAVTHVLSHAPIVLFIGHVRALACRSVNYRPRSMRVVVSRAVKRPLGADQVHCKHAHARDPMPDKWSQTYNIIASPSADVERRAKFVIVE